jgi:hypothetical protein
MFLDLGWLHVTETFDKGQTTVYGEVYLGLRLAHSLYMRF